MNITKLLVISVLVAPLAITATEDVPFMSISGHIPY